MRLFIAAPVPFSRAFEAATRDLLAAVPGVVAVPRGSWHITLRFLGELDDAGDVAVALQSALEGATAVPAMMLGVGAFPRPGRARVAWVSVSAPGLAMLESRIRYATARMGRPPEQRVFEPHVTLGRLKQPANLEPWLRSHGQTLFFQGQLDRIVLFSSELTRKGPVYTPESVVLLQ